MRINDCTVNTIHTAGMEKWFEKPRFLGFKKVLKAQKCKF